MSNRLNKTYLIIDNRERAVIPFIDGAISNYPYVQSNINTGDYLICRAENDTAKILACFERKTYIDFAASFSDGRYENVNKMCQLRKATGCQLYFIIEGPAFPKLTRKFSRIPYVNILSAITKLMTRNNIFVIQTENEQHTAQRLNDFIKAYEDTYLERDPAEFTGGDDTDNKLVIPDMITNVIEQPLNIQATLMWSKLNGISIITGKCLTISFSVAELIQNNINVTEMKTGLGRPINQTAIDSLVSLQNNNIVAATKLLTGIRGVTATVAAQILTSNTLANICKMDIAELSQLPINQKTRTVKLGPAKSEKIIQMLTYKEI